MSKLRAPLKPLLDDQLPERDVQRIWRRLQTRTPARSWTWQLPAASVCCLLLLGGLWLARSPKPSALALAGERVLTTQRTLGGVDPVQLAFSDGSQILLSRGATLEVVDNSGAEFNTRMQRGHGVFEVKPGGPRRWRVDCGLVKVEVIGTGFSIDLSERSVEVHVLHGIVAVRGARVPGGVQRLTAGQSVTVSADQKRDEQAHAPISREESAPAVASERGALPATQTAAVGSKSASRQRSAPAAVSSSQPAADSVDLNSMLRAADAARSSGDERHARELLSEVLRRAPDSRHGAIAAITLGRMQMATDPLAAATSLRAALAAGPPADLREDTQARLVEAYARAGRMDLAREAAAQYRAAFPQGRRGREVQGWAAEP